MADDLFKIQGTISADASDLDQALKTAESSVEQATSSISAGMDKATESTKQTTQAINDLAGGGGGGGTPGIRNLAEEFDNLGSSITGAGRAITALGGLLSGLSLGIIAVGKESLEAAGKFEQWDVAFTNLLHSGEAAKKMLSDLTDFALKTPFNIPGVVENAQKLMAFGFTAEQVIPMLRTLGDAAAGTGKGAEGLRSLTLAMGEMNEKGVVSLRQLNMMAMQGVPAIELLANAYGVSTEEMTQAISKKLVPASEAIPIILEGINEKFGGMMDKQSETFLGMLSNLQDATTKTFKAIGDAMLPAAKDFEQFAFTSLNKAQELAEAFGKLPKPMQDVALAIGAIGAAAGPATLALGGFIWSIGQIVMGLEKLGPVLPAAFTLTGALASIARAAGIAGAAFGGWKLGEWLDTNLVRPSAEHLATIKALEDRLTALGIAFQQQKPSTDSAAAGYAGYLVAALQAAEAANKNAEATKNLNPHLKEHADKVKAVRDAGLDYLPIADQVTMAIANITGEVIHANNTFALALAVYNKLAYGPGSVEEVAKAYEELNKAGRAAGMSQDEINASIGQFSPLAELMSKDIKDLNKDLRESQDDAAAFKALGESVADPFLESIAKLRAEIAQHNTDLDAAIALYAYLAASGTASAQEIAASLKQVETAARTAGMSADDLTIALFNAQNAAAGLPPLTEEEIRALLHMDEVIQGVKTHGLDMAQQIGRSIERDLSRALGDVIFQTGNIADAFKKLGRDVVDIVLNQIIKMALDPLLDKLSSILGSIFGATGSAASAAGGVASSAGGAAGGAGGAVGGAVSGAVGSVLGFANLGVSIASGIVQGFQMAHQETSLNAIELNTRKTSMFIGGLTDGGVQTWTRMTQDNTFNLLQAFNGWFHDAFASLMDSISRIATTPASGGTLHPLAVAPTVNVSVMTKGGNARDVAREIVREIPVYLKSVSPKFSQ